MLKLLPVEMTCAILHRLHSIDIANVAEAVICDRSLYISVFLPCRNFLEPIVEAARRRVHFEKHFGQAHDFADTYELESDKLESDKLESDKLESDKLLYADHLDVGQQRMQRADLRRVRHEHTTAFLRLEDTLHWLPAFDGTMHGEVDYFTELTEFERERLHIEAVKSRLCIPHSFLRLMSNARLMQRLPYDFWLPNRTSISSASQYICNGRDGYLIDFCHKSSRETGSTLWSLWLEPGGSHCVLRRLVETGSTDVWRKPAAQLVGTSFELWLANAFYTHWSKPDVVPDSESYWLRDRALYSCVRRYVQYNCVRRCIQYNCVA